MSNDYSLIPCNHAPVPRKEAKGNTMDKKAILKALKERGFNFSIVADALKVKPRTVIAVCDRDTTSRRVAQAVAKSINKDIKDVFPDVVSYHRDTPHNEVRKRERIQKVTELRSLVA